MRHALVLAGLALLAGRSAVDEVPPRDDRHALLVGVTTYENLPKAKHLVGPGNDVVLLRKLLVERFGFRPERITVLSEAEGAARGPEFLPTRANIEAGFARLAKLPKPGDQAVILLAGHGAQQPEDKNAPEPELDGMDEIFLPRDIAGWDPATRSVKNAIVDNDVADWLRAIRDRKVSVWITFDSCHSGSMMRGVSDVVREWPRDLHPERDLGIPAADIDAARKFAERRAAKVPAKSRSIDGQTRAAPFHLAKEGGVVGFYACQPDEVTYETALPREVADAKVHGLLTYTMCRILAESTGKSHEPITYGELARRIQAEYVRDNRRSPTPLIEGEDRDRTILGDKVWPGRSSILLSVDGARCTIDAGALSGLTAGSVLAVRPPPGSGDGVVGHVRIRDLGVASSVVEPCPFEKAPLVAKLPDGGACSAVFVDVGDLQIRVAVDPRGQDGKPLPAAARARLDKLLALAAAPGSLVRSALRLEDAEWLLRDRRGSVAIAPAGVVGKNDGEIRVEPDGSDVPFAAELATLHRIARAENLRRVATAGTPTNGEGRVRLGLTMRWQKADDRTAPVTWPAPTVPAFDGDRMAIELKNPGKVAIDVTLLYIGRDGSIVPLFPRRPGDLNRLRPGDSVTLPMKFQNDADGQEQLVAIAVKGDGQPIDFSLLAQPKLPIQRGPGVERSLASPLGRLLGASMFGGARSRGMDTADAEECRMTLIPFDVRNERRSEPK
jgi:Caspase domain